MGRYSSADIRNVELVFRTDDLKRQLELVLGDLSTLELYINTLRERIEFLKNLEYTTIWTIYGCNDDYNRNRYDIYQVNIPVQMLSEPHYIIRKNISRFEHVKSFSFEDREIALLCVEELIHRYTIPQGSIHVFTLNDKRLRKHLIKTVDGIYKGRSYKEQVKESFNKEIIMESKGKQLNPRINELGDIIQEKGFESSILADGRPYRVEYWVESEYKFITFCFNALDMLTFEAGDFAKYLAPQLKFHNVPEGQWKKPGIKMIKDEQGNYIWSVTYLHSEDIY